MNPSTPESKEEIMERMERMKKFVQEFSKCQGILIEEDPPLHLTTHHFETHFQTSMPDSLTYSFNNLDNQETHASHFDSYVNLTPDVVDDLSMGVCMCVNEFLLLLLSLMHFSSLLSYFSYFSFLFFLL